MSEWQAFETAPKDRRILIYGGFQSWPEAIDWSPVAFHEIVKWDNDEEFFCGSGSDTDSPYYYEEFKWMELPEPPK